MSPPIVGRADELAAVAAAIHGDRSIVLLGEAGIGKTAVARAAAAASGRTLRDGGAFATLAWVPYLALERAVGQPLAGDPAAVAGQVEAVIGPDLLFVDDLNWAHERTLESLGLLVGRIALVGAVRTGDAGTDAALATMRSAGALILPIGPLAPDAALAIVRKLRPGLTEREGDALLAHAAGNPLLLEELALGGAPSRALATALTGRLDRLAPACRALVDTLAVADRPISRRRLGAGIGDAVALGLVAEDGDGLVRIRHDLVAELVRDELTSDARSRAHLRAAALVTDPADVARHLAAGGRSEEAAALALARLREVEVVDGGGDPAARAALLVVAADASPSEVGLELRLRAARALDEVADWRGVTAALAWNDDHGSQEQLAERDAILAHAAFMLGDVGASRSSLERAGRRSIPPASGAAVRRAIEEATLLVNLDGNVPGAFAAIAGALAALDHADGDPAGRRDLEVLRSAITALIAPMSADVGRVLAASDEAFAARRYRTAVDQARVVQYLLLMTAGAEEALTFLLEQAARFGEHGLTTMSLEFQADAVIAANQTSRPGEGVRLADEVLERPASRRAWQVAGIHRARTLVLLGRYDEAAKAFADLRGHVSEDFLGLGETTAGEADLALWSGRPAVAAERAAAALAMATPIPIGHVLPALTGAWARAELGQPPGDQPPIALPPELMGAAPEWIGLVQRHAGQFEAAAESFDAAAEAWAGFYAARALTCRWAAAEARRLAGAHDLAVDALRAVLDLASASGMEALAARVRRSLRQAGVRGAARAPRRSGEVGLTARERELVALVERGLTNIEIARRLGLGRPTVARILASAMAKLGVERRTQLTAVAPAAT
jgi:DNA-binding CsgD family transcriptional regulator